MKPKLEQIVLTGEKHTSETGTQHEYITLESERVVSTESLAHLWVQQQKGIHLQHPQVKTISYFYPYWCTSLNLTFSLFGMLLLLLILPVLALLIYFDSPGPVFYTQERLGYKGVIFHMYKLRSMHVEARWSTNHARTVKNDSRITRVGCFLRMTHLDELPQVVNILLGHMNLIGPRPEQPGIAATLEEVIPLYRARLNIKPGLTGWAQVMYRYTDTIQNDAVKLKHDMYYILNQSWQIDVQIIQKTVVEVLSGRGR